MDQEYSPRQPDLGARKRKAEELEADQLTDFVRLFSEKAWEEARAFEASMLPFVDQTLEKWDERIRVSSGASALASKKFKTINQSVKSQISQILADKERLMKRTRLRRSDYSCLGENRDVRSDDPLANHDPEVFDDNDFYQMMLKDLIESRMTETNDPIELGMKYLQLKQLQNQVKRKKNVDTKASKGRKIRYQVQEKLLNFMAPQPAGTWHEEMSEELFKGLFGEGTQSLDTEAQPVVPVQDGFKLFA